MGGLGDLHQSLAAADLIALDTMVFSYHLANHPRYTSLTTMILDAVESGQPAGLTTTITLAEILTVPAKAGDRGALQDYEIYLTRFPNLEVVSLDTSLVRETALVRAATGLRTPDAVQIAAACLAGADTIVTNDPRWAGRVTAPALLMLDDYLD